MPFKTITLFVVTCACIVLMTSSCSRYGVCHEPTVVTVSKDNGPPAHAPAHGYRRKHIDGVELVFDSSMGLYVVVGYTDHYYHDGYFYRLSGGVWEMSLKLDGGWKFASEKSLPPGLQVKAKAFDNDNGNGRGRGKDKQKRGVAKTGRPF
jgi:hypothetical protein